MGVVLLKEYYTGKLAFRTLSEARAPAHQPS